MRKSDFFQDAFTKCVHIRKFLDIIIIINNYIIAKTFCRQGRNEFVVRKQPT